jgi:cysteine desulfurase / selenocysteine lyase
MNYKKDFPIFKNNKKLVFLDNASTTQKPKQVIKEISDFYEKENSNVHRGVYKLSENATEKYDESREVIADFINAELSEIVFTRGTTESINLLAYSIKSLISQGKDEILVSEMEHHSNLIPWQELAKRNKMKLKFIKVRDDFTLDLEDAKKKVTNKTAILSIVHVSNTLGTKNPVKELIKIAKKKKILTIIDAAQSIGHMKVNVRDLNCDFLVFSGHKMLGPLGVGVLYGKKNLLEELEVFNTGGGMIKSVSLSNTDFANIPEKFEAGTQNIAGIFGLVEAIRYLNKIGMNNIEKYERNLMNYLLKEIKKVKGIKLYNPKNISGILSFNIKGIPPHDLASLLDDYNVAIRAGHHCTMPLMKALKIKENGTARVSLHIYNIKEDVDKLVRALNKINRKFN